MNPKKKTNTRTIKYSQKANERADLLFQLFDPGDEHKNLTNMPLLVMLSAIDQCQQTLCIFSDQDDIDLGVNNVDIALARFVSAYVVYK
jgi:hypothetical protein